MFTAKWYIKIDIYSFAVEYLTYYKAKFKIWCVFLNIKFQSRRKCEKTKKLDNI